mmetsp:Transcript_921/g.1944  ORF Transcript_921/g.1944 Transcript_921/m.1944 type:complete len:223 (-) Transcript_921:36-704(-)
MTEHLRDFKHRSSLPVHFQGGVEAGLEQELPKAEVLRGVVQDALHLCRRALRAIGHPHRRDQDGLVFGGLRRHGPHRPLRHERRPHPAAPTETESKRGAQRLAEHQFCPLVRLAGILIAVAATAIIKHLCRCRRQFHFTQSAAGLKRLHEWVSKVNGQRSAQPPPHRRRHSRLVFAKRHVTRYRSKGQRGRQSAAITDGTCRCQGWRRREELELLHLLLSCV